MENAWQYSKVYHDQLYVPLGATTLAQTEPSQQWLEWAIAGWSNKSAVRYPRGRGKAPAYSYWNGQKLDYISARKMIYCPLYAQKVVETEAFKQLQQLYLNNNVIYLVDYDGYDYVKQDKTLTQVLNDPTKKMGHAFVLAMLLTNDLCWLK